MSAALLLIQEYHSNALHVSRLQRLVATLTSASAAHSTHTPRTNSQNPDDSHSSASDGIPRSYLAKFAKAAKAIRACKEYADIKARLSRYRGDSLYQSLVPIAVQAASDLPSLRGKTELRLACADDFAKIIPAHKRKFHPVHWVDICVSYARLVRHCRGGDGVMNNALHHIKAEMGSLDASQLTRVAWAVATAATRHDVLTAVSVCAQKAVDSLQPHHISTLAWSFAAANHKSAWLFIKLHERALQLLPEMDLANRAVFLWASAHLQFPSIPAHNQPCHQVFQQAAQLSQGQLHTLDAALLNKMLWAYASTAPLEHAQQLFQEATSSLLARQDELPSADVSQLLWSIQLWCHSAATHKGTSDAPRTKPSTTSAGTSTSSETSSSSSGGSSSSSLAQHVAGLVIEVLERRLAGDPASFPDSALGQAADALLHLRQGSSRAMARVTAELSTRLQQQHQQHQHQQGPLGSHTAASPPAQQASSPAAPAVPMFPEATFRLSSLDVSGEGLPIWLPDGIMDVSQRYTPRISNIALATLATALLSHKLPGCSGLAQLLADEALYRYGQRPLGTTACGTCRSQACVHARDSSAMMLRKVQAAGRLAGLEHPMLQVQLPDCKGKRGTAAQAAAVLPSVAVARGLSSAGGAAEGASDAQLLRELLAKEAERRQAECKTRLAALRAAYIVAKRRAKEAAAASAEAAQAEAGQAVGPRARRARRAARVHAGQGHARAAAGEEAGGCGSLHDKLQALSQQRVAAPVLHTEQQPAGVGLARGSSRPSSGPGSLLHLQLWPGQAAPKAVAGGAGGGGGGAAAGSREEAQGGQHGQGRVQDQRVDGDGGQVAQQQEVVQVVSGRQDGTQQRGAAAAAAPAGSRVWPRLSVLPGKQVQQQGM